MLEFILSFGLLSSLGANLSTVWDIVEILFKPVDIWVYRVYK